MEHPVRPWIAGTVTTLAFFGSLLLHESHSVVAIQKGYRVPSITLFTFGGASTLADEPRDAKSEFIIAGVGPLASFALAGVCSRSGACPRWGAALTSLKVGGRTAYVCSRCQRT